MTTAYIYNVESKEIVVVIEGDDEKAVESKAEEMGYMGVDEYGLSYTDNELHTVTSTENVSAIARWRFNSATQEVLEYDKSQKAYVYFGTYHQIGLTAKMKEAKKIETVEAYQDHMDLVNIS